MLTDEGPDLDDKADEANADATGDGVAADKKKESPPKKDEDAERRELDKKEMAKQRLSVRIFLKYENPMASLVVFRKEQTFTGYYCNLVLKVSAMRWEKKQQVKDAKARSAGATHGLFRDYRVLLALTGDLERNASGVVIIQ